MTDITPAVRDLLKAVKGGNRRNQTRLAVEVYPRLVKDTVRWCVVVINDDTCDEVATGSDLRIDDAAAECLMRVRRFIRKGAAD